MTPELIRVQIDVEGVGKPLTYWAPEGTALGARVEVLLQSVFDNYPRRAHGTVTSLTSDYTGACRAIVKVLADAEVKR